MSEEAMKTDLKELENLAIAIRDNFGQGDYELICFAIAELEELRRGAEYRKANPLGGPGKVFDAMADRIVSRLKAKKK